MSSGNSTVLKDLEPVRCKLGTAQKWYTDHKASEFCDCIHESAKRWRLYWIAKYLENGQEVSRATYARTNNWSRAKILHEWGIDVYDDPETNTTLPQDKNTYGELYDGTTVHLIKAWKNHTGNEWNEPLSTRPSPPAPPA